ncbi:DUF6069 family protein [Micromonospora endolithica]|uniref:Uncharacterized protein n=1 Tax=Micromonospora endolithica TaxID=230091 RepID=A0A3A9ZHL1_9ACTN|nr:DUF6069 family protein [Micromonospora endolithica]RKN47649.1 hypothetical protein D7223_12900 [Micromonospora endolithica]TWJ21316.1 hypothetical protein JD76_01426 [Micromonospora endolithica]
MRTLALRGGARVPVVAAEWTDAFGVVTRGRVQLELRDGEPGPVLGRDAGFWLRGTGVRALRNPDRRTARVRIVTPGTRTGTRRSTTPPASVAEPWRNDMNSMNDTGAVTGPAPGRTSRPHRLRGLAGTGVIATLAAVVATTLAAASAKAVGVDFEIPDGGETIPLSGFAVVTGFFSVVGVVIAAALLRWSARPAERFGWTAASLTAISLVPPLISGADTATITALLGLHLVPAAVMIPALTRSLRTRSD